MAEKFLLEIVTPYQNLLSEEVDEMTATAEEGEFGVLAGHTPYLTVLRPGELTYKRANSTARVALGRGYAEVTPEKTTILVEKATPEEAIDLNGAKKALAEAEDALKGIDSEDPKFRPAMDAFEFAEVQVRIKER